jgi:hypothetical protein
MLQSTVYSSLTIFTGWISRKGAFGKNHDQYRTVVLTVVQFSSDIGRDIEGTDKMIRHVTGRRSSEQQIVVLWQVVVCMIKSCSLPLLRRFY